MKRGRFLKYGASFLSITPLTPLVPTINMTNPMPLPFATASPAVNGSTSSSLLNTSNGPTYYLATEGPETGPALPLQQQLQNGVRGAIDDANAQRGTLDRVVDIHLYDDLGNASDARGAASSAVADIGALATIGHLGSACTVAALETYAQAQMPLIVPISTDDDVTKHGYTNVFRLATKDTFEGRIFGQHLLKLYAPKSIAVISPTDGYGSVVAEAFAVTADKAKIPTLRLRVPVIAEVDELETILAPLLKAKPDLVFFAGTFAALSASFHYLRAQGCEARFAASQGFFDVGTVTQLGPLAEGLIVSSSMPPIGYSAAQSLKIEAYRENYGDLTPIAAFAYAAAQIAITAIRTTEAVSRPPIVRTLSQGNTFTTIVGDFRFDSFGDPLDPNLYYYTVKNSAWVPSGSKRPTIAL